MEPISSNKLIGQTPLPPLHDRLLTLIKPKLGEKYWHMGAAAGTGASSFYMTFMSLDKTKVVVQSGETVVMGGVINTTEINEKREVPFLSKIPLIGAFFRHSTVDEQDENLLIFVTATILSERGEDMIPVNEFTRPAAGGEAVQAPAAPNN